MHVHKHRETYICTDIHTEHNLGPKHQVNIDWFELTSRCLGVCCSKSPNFINVLWCLSKCKINKYVINIIGLRTLLKW